MSIIIKVFTGRSEVHISNTDKITIEDIESLCIPQKKGLAVRFLKFNKCTTAYEICYKLTNRQRTDLYVELYKLIEKDYTYEQLKKKRPKTTKAKANTAVIRGYKGNLAFGGFSYK